MSRGRLWNEIRIAALRRKITATEAVEQALRLWVGGPDEAAYRCPVGDGVLAIPCAPTLDVLPECERIKGLEDQTRGDFARGDDPVEVLERYNRF